MGERSRLRTSLSRLASHDREEARELRKESRDSGVVSIADAVERERVTLQGKISTVTLRPRGGVPALEAELYDGSDSLTLVFLGRRRIAGVAPGVAMRVQGRFGTDKVMFNPRYELRP
ncbi:hypothetical protein GCM10011519_02770 [Marmoricola endophyticus]|uniref:DNA-binding protein n=1 Tax=Marmoricola endophyticus TaxID=2040280 RepID=A0A917F0J7_9ACTN|nr:OB-fold nucleic acid binding domain-containing protein [Marmoricola endophyticus]GGF32779.1 hypothetical protein GCM10011519_02770 [Marmoricola endophyticus]